VHHAPAGIPPFARVRTALRRVAGEVRRSLPRPLRALPILLAGMTVGVLALAAPVVSSASGGAAVSLDASSSGTAQAKGGAPVVMGVDGRPVSPGTGGRSTSATGTSSAGGAGVTSGARSGTAPGPGSTTATTRGGTRAATTDGTTSATAPGTSSSSPSSSPSSSSSAPSSSPPSSAPAPAVVADAGDAVLAAVNAARADAGCAALAAAPSLVARAQANSVAMGTQGTLAVLDSAGSASAIGQSRPDAAAMVAVWLADPTARPHLVDCALITAGAAEATGSAGPWWTLFLG